MIDRSSRGFVGAVIASGFFLWAIFPGPANAKNQQITLEEGSPDCATMTIQGDSSPVAVFDNGCKENKRFAVCFVAACSLTEPKSPTNPVEMRILKPGGTMVVISKINFADGGIKITGMVGDTTLPPSPSYR